jgi:hypothetical protein
MDQVNKHKNHVAFLYEHDKKVLNDSNFSKCRHEDVLGIGFLIMKMFGHWFPHNGKISPLNFSRIPH